MRDFDDYQAFTDTTAKYKESCPDVADQVLYCTLGLMGEAGEIAEKVKKRLRKFGKAGFEPGSEGFDEFVKALRDELGDPLWYAAQLARLIGHPLSVIAERNIQKLTSRQERGLLHGEGDNR